MSTLTSCLRTTSTLTNSFTNQQSFTNFIILRCYNVPSLTLPYQFENQLLDFITNKDLYSASNTYTNQIKEKNPEDETPELKNATSSSPLTSEVNLVATSSNSSSQSLIIPSDSNLPKPMLHIQIIPPPWTSESDDLYKLPFIGWRLILNNSALAQKLLSIQPITLSIPAENSEPTCIYFSEGTHWDLPTNLVLPINQNVKLNTSFTTNSKTSFKNSSSNTFDGIQTITDSEYASLVTRKPLSFPPVNLSFNEPLRTSELSTTFNQATVQYSTPSNTHTNRINPSHYSNIKVFSQQSDNSRFWPFQPSSQLSLAHNLNSVLINNTPTNTSQHPVYTSAPPPPPQTPPYITPSPPLPLNYIPPSFPPGTQPTPATQFVQSSTKPLGPDKWPIHQHWRDVSDATKSRFCINISHKPKEWSLNDLQIFLTSQWNEFNKKQIIQTSNKTPSHLNRGGTTNNIVGDAQQFKSEIQRINTLRPVESQTHSTPFYDSLDQVNNLFTHPLTLKVAISENTPDTTDPMQTPPTDTYLTSESPIPATISSLWVGGFLSKNSLDKATLICVSENIQKAFLTFRKFSFNEVSNNGTTISNGLDSRQYLRINKWYNETLRNT